MLVLCIHMQTLIKLPMPNNKAAYQERKNGHAYWDQYLKGGRKMRRVTFAATQMACLTSKTFVMRKTSKGKKEIMELLWLFLICIYRIYYDNLTWLKENNPLLDRMSKLPKSWVHFCKFFERSGNAYYNSVVLIWTAKLVNTEKPIFPMIPVIMKNFTFPRVIQASRCGIQNCAE